MANNQYVNRVDYDGSTLIDITDTTATASDVAQGKYFYLASGQKVAGSASGGHVSQDAQGYLVLDDDAMSGAPSGTISITQNGNVDVAQYAQASVAVVQTYTATISGTGSSQYHYVQKNGSGTKYYTDGATFTFEDGDDIYLVYRSMGSGSGGTTLTANGVLIRRDSESTTTRSYTVENPRCDITIEFTPKTSTTMSNINFTVPSAMVASITENGIASIGGSAFANVAVPGMTNTELRNFIARSADFTDIEWPSGITTIGSYAFAQCSKFNPASLPSTITSINSHAFYGCSSLAITSLPTIGTTISTYTFYGCTSLALTSLPSNLKNINSYAFQNCSSLALTSLPSSLASLGTYSFSGCTNLALTSLPSSLESLSGYAFQNCNKITVSELPIGVTSLASGVFLGCTSITSIRSDAVITATNTNFMIGSSSNPTMSLASASFPNMTAANISTLFGSTTAAYACQLLEFCDIGSTQSIAGNAFANCYALETLVLRRSDAICSLAAVSAFLNTPIRGYNSLTGTVYVPSALISTYQTATNWKTIYDAGTVTFAAIEGSDYEISE